MSDSILQQIHQLMRGSKLEDANALLLNFVQNELTLPFQVTSGQLRPSAVSLNSINGTLETSAGKKFFKTHIEPDSIIGEYYNATMLQQAGWPIIAPIFVSKDYGKQFLIYDWFEATSVFDCVRGLETGSRNDSADLLEAMQASDTQLAELYANSLQSINADQHSQQPIHQLFLHRLAGRRLTDFYGGNFALPDETTPPFSELAARQWVVNGVAYQGTFRNMIESATATLRFADQMQIGAVVGHGDAHAGNVFYTGKERPITYFDPAFAGRHSPLLDVIKPLIHNSLVNWLYFPAEIAAKTQVRYRLTDTRIEIEHDFRPTELRLAFFESKLNRVIKPTVDLLRTKGLLPQNWQAIMQSAAMCCPFLVMNLADRNKFPATIGLVGLATAVEFAGLGENPAQTGLLQTQLSSIR